MELLRAGEVREDDDGYVSPLDELFDRLEMVNPEHIALKYYRDYHSGSAKTLKSIQITLAARWIVNTFSDNFFKVILPVLYRGLISQRGMYPVMVIPVHIIP